MVANRNDLYVRMERSVGLLAHSSSCKSSLLGFLYKQRNSGLRAQRGSKKGLPGVQPRGLAAFGRCYLDVSVQQLLCEMLQRHGNILWAVSLPVERRDMGRVAGKRLGVEVLKGFEVIVDGMSHHYLPCEYFQDLKSVWKRW